MNCNIFEYETAVKRSLQNQIKYVHEEITPLKYDICDNEKMHKPHWQKIRLSLNPLEFYKKILNN